jgi:hypothetical protein
MSDLLIKRNAIISPDEVHRFRLDRDLNRPGRVAAFGMVNPSKADGDIDDQTIRKLFGFAERYDIGRFIVWNKFAFRATNIKELKSAPDPVGPDNDRYIEEALREADVHIVAWGALTKLPRSLRGRWWEVVAIAGRVGCPLMCLGTANDGHPLHPAMIGYDRPLVPWERPR